MTSPNLLETLASYVPTLVVRRFISNPAPLTEPEAERFPAAVLFADITGFTPLAERMAQRGPAGTEELTRILNAYFGQFIDLVTVLGGDVIKFAGDAALAIWPATDEDPSLSREEALSLAIRRAAQSGLALQMILNDYPAAEVRLSMRVGIGAGEVLTASVGGMFGRWEFLVTGAPLAQMSAATKQAQPGQVILSPEAQQLVQDQCVGQLLATGAIQLEDVRHSLPPRLPGPPVLVPEMESALRAYIPGAIQSRLGAGQTEWLSELRHVTVVFLNVTGLPATLTLDSEGSDVSEILDQMQKAMHALQTALYRYEGSVNQFIVDDKGVNLVAALGLPPLAHEDDAVRGVQAVLEMHTNLRKLGLQCTIGVASGPVFCGARGNEQRREYAMIGDVVNLSARLSQAAKSLSTSSEAAERPIMCDSATYEASKARIEFETLAAITLKGKAEPVPVYRPCGEKRKAALVGSKTSIVGRVVERAILAESLDELVRGTSGVIIIEGDAGIGKSRLVDDLRQQAGVMHVGTLAGGGDAVETSTPYHGWRGVFSQLFDVSILADPDAQRRHFLDLLEDEPELLRLAPLLNPVLPFHLPDSDLTAQMTGQVWAYNTRQLLIRLLQDSVNRSPKMIILEDAQWLDSASWALVLAVVQHVRPFLLLVATRPLPEPLPTEYLQLLEAPYTQYLHLQPLPAEDVIELVCQRLGIASLPDRVAQLILQKAEGHPFFSEELAYALRDSGVITVNGDGRSQGETARCQVASSEDLEAVLFPDTVQGVITSRIDRLAPSQQLMLKVASVIGRVFPYRILHAVYPIEADKPYLRDYLEALEQLDITLLEMPEPDLAYTFKHSITQEVVYNLMAFGQRRRLHRAVAEWYEATFGRNGDGEDKETGESLDLSPYLLLLVHHYHHAGDTERERHYAKLAGEHAAAQFANAEAVRYLNRALDLAPEEDYAERYELLLVRERVYDLQGNREAQKQDIQSLEWLADVLEGDSLPLGRQRQAEVALRQAHYAAVTGDYLAAIVAVQVTLDLIRADRNTSLEAAAYLQWGRALRLQGDSKVAQLQLERALALARTEARPLARADRQVEADSLLNLGIVSTHQGDYAGAEAYYDQALRIFREIGDRRGEGDVFYNLGVVSAEQDDCDKAMTYFERAVLIKREIGDQWGESVVLSNLGDVSLCRGDYARARAYYEQTIRICREIGNWAGEGSALNSLGDVCMKQGDYAGARAYLEQALHIYREIGDREGESRTLLALASLFHQVGDDETARQYDQRAQQMLQELGNLQGQGEALT